MIAEQKSPVARAKLTVRLPDAYLERLRILSRQIQPACRTDAVSPAAEHLARKISRTWPTNAAIERARVEELCGARPQPLSLTAEAYQNLRAVASIRGAGMGLLMRAAIASLEL